MSKKYGYSRIVLTKLSTHMAMHAFRCGPINSVRKYNHISKEELARIMDYAVTNIAAIYACQAVGKGKFTHKSTWIYSQINWKWDPPDWELIDLLQHSSSQRKRHMTRDEITKFSKYIVFHALRQGPIEWLHGSDLILDDEMKAITKYAVTHIAAIIESGHADSGWYCDEESWCDFQHEEHCKGPDWKQVDMYLSNDVNVMMELYGDQTS